jgi:hypothetical protein
MHAAPHLLADSSATRQPCPVFSVGMLPVMVAIPMRGEATEKKARLCGVYIVLWTKKTAIEGGFFK